MGEGWSDWYAMDFLVAQRLRAGRPTSPARSSSARTSPRNSVSGIRDKPLDCPVDADAPACPGTPPRRAGRLHVRRPRPRRRLRTGHAELRGPRRRRDLGRDAVGPARRSAPRRPRETDHERDAPLAGNPSFLDERDAILQADRPTTAVRTATRSGRCSRSRDGLRRVDHEPNATHGIASSAPRRSSCRRRSASMTARASATATAAVEPGEAAVLRIALSNPGVVGLTNVHATLYDPDARGVHRPGQRGTTARSRRATRRSRRAASRSRCRRASPAASGCRSRCT